MNGELLCEQPAAVQPPTPPACSSPNCNCPTRMGMVMCLRAADALGVDVAKLLGAAT